MREFFKSEMETLKAKTGLNQFENLSAMPDAAKQFKILFDSLELVRKEFFYMPDDTVKQIVQEQIIRDTDFTALNSRVLWKWLNARKDLFWAQYQAKMESEANNQPPVPYDQLPDSLKAEIEAFKRSLSEPGAGLKVVPSVTHEEIEAIKHEDEVSRGQAVAKNYHQRELELKIRERREKAIRERGLDKLQLHELKKFDIDGIDVWARNKEEAQELYIEIYVNE